MRKLTKKSLTVRAEVIRRLSVDDVSHVAGASVATCPPTIGNACATLRTCVGHATCFC